VPTRCWEDRAVCDEEIVEVVVGINRAVASSTTFA
jgi:hypothetical protein